MWDAIFAVQESVPGIHATVTTEDERVSLELLEQAGQREGMALPRL